MPELDSLSRLQLRHGEYVALSASIDRDKPREWGRLDDAFDELTGALGIHAGSRGPDLLAHLLAVAVAARDEHDKRCGCTGEACELGVALTPLITDESL